MSMGSDSLPAVSLEIVGAALREVLSASNVWQLAHDDCEAQECVMLLNVLSIDTRLLPA